MVGGEARGPSDVTREEVEAGAGVVIRAAVSAPTVFKLTKARGRATIVLLPLPEMSPPTVTLLIVEDGARAVGGRVIALRTALHLKLFHIAF